MSSVPLGALQKRYVKVANSGDHSSLPKHDHGQTCASRQMRLYHVATLFHVNESCRAAQEVSEDVQQARSLKSVGLRSRAEPQALSQTNTQAQQSKHKLCNNIRPSAAASTALHCAGRLYVLLVH